MPLRRSPVACVASAVVAATLTLGSASLGAPQANAGLYLGTNWSHSEAAPAPSGSWGLSTGARADVLFGRHSPSDLGVGPYFDFQSVGVRNPSFGSGCTLLLPVNPSLPLLLSVGPYLALRDDEWRPGGSLSAFWGVRDYNYHGPYSMSAGLLAQFKQDVSVQRESAVHLDLQVDLALLGLPLLIAWEALSGPSPAAAPLPR